MPDKEIRVPVKDEFGQKTGHRVRYSENLCHEDEVRVGAVGITRLRTGQYVIIGIHPGGGTFACVVEPEKARWFITKCHHLELFNTKKFRELKPKKVKK